MDVEQGEGPILDVQPESMEAEAVVEDEPVMEAEAVIEAEPVVEAEVEDDTSFSDEQVPGLESEEEILTGGYDDSAMPDSSSLENALEKEQITSDSGSGDGSSTEVMYLLHETLEEIRETKAIQNEILNGLVGMNKTLRMIASAIPKKRPPKK